jgi:hypothetical protein
MVVTESAGRSFNMETFGQRLRQGFDGKLAEPRVIKTSRDYMREMSEDMARRSGNARVVPLQPGQSRFFVSTMGMPGQERVVSAAREEYFADGKLPAVDSVKDAFIEKYGAPSEANDTGNVVQMWWEYDPTGRKIAQQSCRISVSPDAATNLSTACGITVGAQIQRSNTNVGLAHSLAVSTQHGAGGYALIETTEEALRRGDTAKKAKELEDASKSGSKPRL